jgi:hypothetical protein
MWKAMTIAVMSVCGLGLGSLVGPDALGADAVDNAFRLCAAFEKTGLSTECDVRGWGSTVDVRLDTTSAEARKMCAAMVDLLVQQQLSGEHPIAVCTLK